MELSSRTHGDRRIETPTRVLGIDFTSAPRPGKPITMATGALADGKLRIESVRLSPSFERFEEEIASPGPWIAGIDFPFGQPRRLIRAVGWPQESWRACVRHIKDMGKESFERAVKNYTDRQPYGDKEHQRNTDRHARSKSPMKLGRPPVGKMFFQGAPRILRSGASIVPCALNDSDRVIVEAYPALTAEALADTRSYKKQTRSHEDARRRIVVALTGARCKAKYDLIVHIDSTECRDLIEDPAGDLLDAVLCAIQAAWSSVQPAYGVPETCDLLEGWIVDPSQVATDRGRREHPAVAVDLGREEKPRGRKPMRPSESTLLERISTDPSICHGRPCIRGLRYPVDMILELLSAGMRSEEILADYEDLEREDILAALAFAARLCRVKRVQALV